MIILTIRTDNPEAEIGLYDDKDQLDYEIWHGHRLLAESLLTKVSELLKRNNSKLEKLQGIVCYKGPGSFTGLRIGLSVGNALGYGLQIPVAGTMNETWIADGIDALQNGENERLVIPEYGADVHITPPKH